MLSSIKKIILIALVGFAATTYANNFSCQPYQPKIQNKNIVLTTTGQQVFLLKNTSVKSLWIDHQTNRPAGAGWSSYLTSNHWSALALDSKKDFALSCAVIHPGKVEYLNCANVLSLCVPKEVVFQDKSKHRNFWIVEDKTWEDLLSGIAKRKINIK